MPKKQDDEFDAIAAGYVGVARSELFLFMDAAEDAQTEAALTAAAPAPPTLH